MICMKIEIPKSPTNVTATQHPMDKMVSYGFIICLVDIEIPLMW